MAVKSFPKTAVILAGGKGTRLLPYTTILPKPLLPLGDRPIILHVIDLLKSAGVDDIVLSVGYLAEHIMAFFGNGEKFGVNIRYAIEAEPLGTIGPLQYIEDLGENFFVMNGDLLTDFNPRQLWDAQEESHSILTIATFKREVYIDFGVLTYSENMKLQEFTEKPILPYNVSMGIYLLNKRCLDYVPKGKAFGFDGLVTSLLEHQEPIRVVPHNGYWLDIGRPEDYQKAIQEFKE